MAPPGPPIGTKGVGSTVPVADVYNIKNYLIMGNAITVNSSNRTICSDIRT